MSDKYQPLRDAVAARSWPVGASFPRNMDLLGDLLKEWDALLAIRNDTLLAVRNDTLERAALICDARERRAGTSQAQACYRLMAKDIRALKRAALATAPEPPAHKPMTAEQVASACYTYRHDFGLLPEDERHLLMAEARRWAEAFGIGKGESNEG